MSNYNWSLIQFATDASWEKRKATPTQRNNLWRCTRRHLVPTDDPKYRDASFGEIMQLDHETEPKYFGMEHVFWIRVSSRYYSCASYGLLTLEI